MRLLALAALTAASVLAGPGALAADETGRPILRFYAPGEHLSAIPSPRVIQDGNGVMYFANGVHVLRFDGLRWGTIPLSETSAGVRQFTADDDGNIYLAGPGVIGWLHRTETEAKFVSLADRLPPEAANIDELRCAVAVHDTVFFSDDEKVLRWQGNAFSWFPFPAPAGTQGVRLHRVGNTLYLSAPGRGLWRWKDDAPERVSEDAVLRENRIVTIDPEPDGSLTLLTAERGFYRLDPAGDLQPWATEMNRWLAGRRVFAAQRLPDGSRVVGFSAAGGDGGLRFTPEGRLAGPLDTSIGLTVNTVRDFHVDREHGLWLGLDTGAARLEWPSAASLYDTVNGLGRGAVADLARHAGTLHVATSEGLFRLLPADEHGRMARFERLHTQEFFSLASHPEGLLALSNSVLYQVTPHGVVPLLRIPAGGGRLRLSSRDPSRLWIGTPQGLRTLRHTGGAWRDEGMIPGITDPCRDLREAADGSLWYATSGSGLWRIAWRQGTTTTAEITPFAGGHGLPSPLTDCLLFEHAGDTAFLAAGDTRVRRFDAARGAFVPLGERSLPSAVPATVAAVAMPADALWLASQEAIHQVSPQGVARRLPHFVLATVGQVTLLHEEPGPRGPVLWIGGSGSLVRVETANAFTTPVPFRAWIKAQELPADRQLPPQHAPVVLTYAATRQRPTHRIVYQTQLAGLDDRWSDWTPRRERIFTHLPPGPYRFLVRARDSDGVISETAALDFVVLAPWWRSHWAYLGYTLTALLAVAGIVHLRTRSLRRHAARLEAIIDQRTAELARQNQELVRLHRLEFDEKIFARLAEEKARLEMLRYQLNPHFLFNTLVSIRASLPADAKTAQGMVERLSDFCRLTLHRSGGSEFTNLREEMKLLRVYLEIEQARWGDLLRTQLDCAPAIEETPLPHFLLLPLVENALKYGRATSPDRIEVRVTARSTPEQGLVLEIANTGEWVAPEARGSIASLGIGLDNLRERLARHYPGSHALEITPGAGWVTVTLRLGPLPAR